MALVLVLEMMNRHRAHEEANADQSTPSCALDRLSAIQSAEFQSKPRAIGITGNADFT